VGDGSCQQDDQDYRDDELWQCSQGKQPDRGCHVEGPVSLEGCICSDGDRQGDRHRAGDEDQERGVLESARKKLGYRFLGSQRNTGMAVQQPVDPVPVLGEDRLVQMELTPERGKSLRSG